MILMGAPTGWVKRRGIASEDNWTPPVFLPPFFGNSLVPHRNPFCCRGLGSMIRGNWGKGVFLRHSRLERKLWLSESFRHGSQWDSPFTPNMIMAVRTSAIVRI